MKTKISIILAGILVVSALFIKPTFAEAPQPLVKDLSPKEAISYFAHLYGANEPVLMEMGRGESNFNPDAFDPDDGGHWSGGLFGYKQATFDRYSGYMGEKLDIHSYHDQAKLTAWIYVNKPNERAAWTTYRCIKNHGSYTFKYEGGYHTTYCKGDLVI